MTSGLDEYMSSGKHIDYEKEREYRMQWINSTGGAARDNLTVRDYFAAKAMQGFTEQWVYDNSDVIASMAYVMADAMMKERAK